MGLTKTERKERIKRRIASSGTAAKPRLSVFRSNKEIYAQLINDDKGITLVAASSRDKVVAAKGTKTQIANAVGKIIAEKALALNITTVAFDRGGNRYHGRVKSLAEGAREAGLKF